MPEYVTSRGEVLCTSARHDRAQVTVAVTLYNYADLVTAALDSVRAQDLDDIDLIVVDDHSTDGGEARVLEWLHTHADRFGRATLLRHARNEQLAAARNHAFACARTPFVFVLDADNMLYPRCLSACLAAAQQTGAEAVYSLIEVFGDETGVLGTDLWDPIALRNGNYIDAMALIRRSAWEHVGGYRALHGWEDYDLWLKFAEANFTLVRVPEILCRYRKHARSMLQTVTRHAAANGRLQQEMRRYHPQLLNHV